MVSPLGSSPFAGSNPYTDGLGGAFNPEIYRLRATDADIRTSVKEAVTSAGRDALTTATFQYAIGPDGQVYVTGATVTSTRKVNGPRTFANTGPGATQDEKPQTDLFRQSLQSQRRPSSLSELLSPQLGLSPTDQAILFGQDVAEAVGLARLNNADIGVRSHEGEHFRSAGGLAVGIPEFEYVKGPDGKYYAIGGHVNVQTSTTSDPIKAAREASIFSNAATSPGDASAQDLSVARRASTSVASLYAATGNALFYTDNEISLNA